MTALQRPTRRDEDFRYSDLDALAQVWPVAVERLAVAPGARETLTIELEGSRLIARELAVTIGRGGGFDLRVLNAGRVFGRVAVHVELAEGATFDFGAVQLGSGPHTLEIVTKVMHAGPDATSRQTVRSVLADRATGSYLGKVAVARGADGTDAAQSVRAMLLDRTATANAKPELEIYADDVKCAHGCAIGELDGGALFYLQSRGLPPEAARRLMLQAFVAEAFVGAPDEERLNGLALAALEALL